MTQERVQPAIERMARLVARGEIPAIRDELITLLKQANTATWLRALDQAGLLTQIIPELEPARTTDQPIVHFLPVLAHSIEAVAAVDWLFGELGITPARSTTPVAVADLPVAVQTHPYLHYTSAYAARFRAHFASTLAGGRRRGALFKLATLLHDNAKPQTRQPKPGGGVSFHAHQSLGGEVARRIAGRLAFAPPEVEYIGVVVKEHMRPGQLAELDAVTLRAVQRFFAATGDAGPDVLLHSLADHMATRGPRLDVAAWFAHAAWTEALLEIVWGEEREITAPLLNGHDLMQALGIPQGPVVGRLLAAVGEAQAGGEITTREEALALARRLLREV